MIEIALPRVALSEAGVHLELENVDLEILRGELALDGVRAGLPPSNGRDAMPEPLLEVSRLFVGIEWRDLLSRSVNLRELRVEAPILRFTQRSNGSFIMPAAQGSSPPDDAEAAEGSSPPDDADATEAVQAAAWRYRLDHLELDSLALSLTLEASNETVLDLQIPRLAIDGLSLGEAGIELGPIAIHDPDLDVQRAWLFAENDAVEPVEVATSPDESPATLLRAASLEIEAGSFSLRIPGKPIELSLQLTASDFATAPGHRFPVEVAMRVGEAGEVEAEVELGLDPLFLAGGISWSELPIPVFLALDNPELIPWLRSCEAAGDVEVELRTAAGDEPAALMLRGSGQVANFALNDPDGDDLALEWESLDVVIREAFFPLDPESGLARRMELERFEIVSPTIAVTRPPEAVDRLVASFGGVIDAPEDAPDAVPEANGGPAAEATIDDFVMRKGTLRLVDRTVSPTHETRIEGLEIEAKSLRLPHQQVESFLVTGDVRGNEPFSIAGWYRGGNADISIELEGLDLVPYDPFARAAGWRIVSGETSLQSKIELSGRRYAIQNEILLHHLEVHSDAPAAFTAAFGVTPDLALALMRQPNGDIDLTIPVTGDRDAVAVDLRTVLVDVLQETITGTLASPLKLMGMVLPVSGRPASMEPVPYEPGSDEMQKDADRRIESLATVTASRPELVLTLLGQTAPADRSAVAIEMLREDVETGRDLPKVEGAGLFATRRVRSALAKHKLDALSEEDAALLARFVERRDVPRDRLESLARARAESARDALIESGAPAASIEIGAVREGDVPGVVLGLNAAGG